MIFALAYGTFCPGPAHMLKPQHPKYSKNTYDQYRNAFPPTYMNMPVMGAWVPVEYRSDDIVVMRRNPYYWKVDEEGHQLPYLDELQYRLSTWADRDVQAVAGTGDFSNLEQPESYVEALKRSADPAAPARLGFGPRSIGYTLFPNLSGNGWGEPDARGQAVRELNRNLDFRKAVTMAIDRQRLGESLVKGPFTAIYPGGIMDVHRLLRQGLDRLLSRSTSRPRRPSSRRPGSRTPTATASSTCRHGGGNVEITLLINGDYATDKSLGEGVVAMMETLGIRVIPNILSGNDRDAAQLVGQVRLAGPPQRPGAGHRGAEHRAARAGRPADRDQPPAPDRRRARPARLREADGRRPQRLRLTDDAAKRKDLIKDFQKTYTENLYGIGLTVYPGALIINKRFSNIPPGTPINMYNWAEDSIIRERVWVAADQQKDYELFPDTLPGEPGGEGPVK